VAAFLYADIKEELYINLLEGFKEFDSNGMELFGRLQKALYGTKHDAYEWRSKFDKFLIEIEIVYQYTPAAISGPPLSMPVICGLICWSRP
jgi:hypothetical protein